MNKVYDCIPFYQSNILFELRLKTLEKYVDFFVVCEATKTHSGSKKKLNFDLKKFIKITNKIKYIVVDNIPNKLDTKYNKYPLYNYQIDELSKVTCQASDEDIIIVSDEDEIPSPEALVKFKSDKYKYGIFLQKVFYYKFNIQNLTEYEGNKWPGSRICKKKFLKSFSWFRSLKTKNSKLPFWKFWKEKNIQLLENGGWHFTYLMDYNKISEKIKSSEHQEFNKIDYNNPEKIKYRIERLIDPFDRNFTLKKVEIDESFPEQIRNNKNYYKEWILE